MRGPLCRDRGTEGTLWRGQDVRYNSRPRAYKSNQRSHSPIVQMQMSLGTGAGDRASGWGRLWVLVLPWHLKSQVTALGPWGEQRERSLHGDIQRHLPQCSERGWWRPHRVSALRNFPLCGLICFCPPQSQHTEKSSKSCSPSVLFLQQHLPSSQAFNNTL